MENGNEGPDIIRNYVTKITFSDEEKKEPEMIDDLTYSRLEELCRLKIITIQAKAFHPEMHQAYNILLKQVNSGYYTYLELFDLMRILEFGDIKTLIMWETKIRASRFLGNIAGFLPKSLITYIIGYFIVQPLIKHFIVAPMKEKYPIRPLIDKYVVNPIKDKYFTKLEEN